MEGLRGPGQIQGPPPKTRQDPFLSQENIWGHFRVIWGSQEVWGSLGVGDWDQAVVLGYFGGIWRTLTPTPYLGAVVGGQSCEIKHWFCSSYGLNEVL